MKRIRIERKTGPIVRAAVALATFFLMSGAAFVALTEMAAGLLEAVASGHSDAVGFAMVIYAPVLVIFLVVGVAGGLWASRQAYLAPKRWASVRSIGFLLVAVLALLAGAIGLLSAALPKNDVPPLALGLHGPAREVNEVFARRLASRFPAGTPEDVLIGELRAERFIVEPAKHKATFDGDGFPCRNTWNVFWRADDGRLVTITGSLPKLPSCL